MSEYNKAVNHNAKVLNHDSKDYHDGHDYIPSNIHGNQINQDYNQVNQDNPVKIKVQTFKQTEIGVIPEDWEVASIDNVSYVDPDNLTSSTNPEYNFNYISLEDVDNGILKSFSELNFKDAPSRARRKIKINDVLISTVRPNLKSHLHIRGDVKDWICSTGFAVLRCKNNIANSEFLFNHFFAFIINKQIDNLITGSNYPAISNKEVKSLKIPLPPLPEQKAIARVLSDTDNLIQAITQKLAKKRAIKQGAMQQLLTPKEDWEVKTLGEILQFGNGKDYKHLKSGHIPVYGTGGIISFVNDYLFDGESVGIGRKGTIDKPIFLNGKFWTVDTLFFTHSFKDSNPKYIYHQFRMINWKDYNEASGVPSLSKKTLEEIKIRIPFIKEQNRIATILSDMDTEIEQIEQKLSKYKLLKQGLMQQLLTGKIRLV